MILRTGRSVISRVLFVVFLVAVGAFFAIPLAWLMVAPFDASPSMSVQWPDWTLANFRTLAENPYTLRSIGNSLLLAVGTMAVTVVTATLASYALSRVRIPGRDALLYGMLLLSSIVTGTAAMVPTFQLMTAVNLIDTRTGVALVLTGGLLPTVIFILKDFMDSVPRSYEESARLYGASRLQVLTHVVVPVARPGIAFVAIWGMVQVWGNFLVPFLLLRDPNTQPAAVLMYTFYTEAGQADLRLISVFSLIFVAPVLVIYLVVNRKFGFRFFGGIKA
ncbi:carbohydrate ABC transporter permease [Brachybacterium sp. UMB0905]|uniref:carbohydrate ABC transporter permease n=1 Tax=Brachybacterium sp. UMB0905 TaxID=2069310 RepID=UPI000C80322A|nr:carbohydrate ABC transporter permease [Brachybacterium sp. UMB0905]PMC74579.1 ABC transporter permease [Brachybacterium sp. UMB0905]